MNEMSLMYLISFRYILHRLWRHRNLTSYSTRLISLLEHRETTETTTEVNGEEISFSFE